MPRRSSRRALSRVSQRCRSEPGAAMPDDGAGAGALLGSRGKYGGELRVARTGPSNCATVLDLARRSGDGRACWELRSRDGNEQRPSGLGEREVATEIEQGALANASADTLGTDQAIGEVVFAVGGTADEQKVRGAAEAGHSVSTIMALHPILAIRRQEAITPNASNLASDASRPLKMGDRDECNADCFCLPAWCWASNDGDPAVCHLAHRCRQGRHRRWSDVRSPPTASQVITTFHPLAMVQAGDLPPVEERLPDDPLVLDTRK